MFSIRKLARNLELKTTVVFDKLRNLLSFFMRVGLGIYKLVMMDAR